MYGGKCLSYVYSIIANNIGLSNLQGHEFHALVNFFIICYLLNFEYYFIASSFITILALLFKSSVSFSNASFCLV